MKKLIFGVLLAMFAMPGMLTQVYAADDAAPAGIVDVGNKMCPVMDEPVDGEHFVVYEGKRYGLCCPGCEKAFLADPAQYIAKLNAGKTANEAASAEMQRDMEQAEL